MRLRPLLERIVQAPGLHARFLNAVARMKYVGARKILKSRRSLFLRLEDLEHTGDELRHSFLLKQAALAIAGAPEEVATFADDQTLAGAAAEAYLQGVDEAAEQALLDLPDPLRTEVNYLFTTVAAEVRADAFYPVYDRVLELAGSDFRVTGIFHDGVRHLNSRRRRLESVFPGWTERIDQVLAQEELLFDRFLDEIEAACAAHVEPE
ncbi:MAG: hypothetical protein D6702_12320 [Planctomycetota bacterium]|nr:MAG: hypothetical protein D6702_12320 [Planctomycetota bacterium]